MITSRESTAATVTAILPLLGTIVAFATLWLSSAVV